MKEVFSLTVGSFFIEDWSQKKISVLESKEKIEDALLAEIAKILKVPEEAIRNLTRKGL